jgi:hypothetical protein
MVIRAGTGIFYERFSESYTQNADRLNGVNQQSFAVPGLLLARLHRRYFSSSLPDPSMIC